MSWKERIRPASLRDIGFFIVSVRKDLGRRLAVHIYPQSDACQFEDNGRKPRRFTVEGKVIGDDYLDQLDRLEAAAETPGPAKFVDTYFGSKTVRCETFTPGVTEKENRVAYFSFSFYEDSTVQHPSSQIDTQSAVKASGAESKKVVLEKFAAEYSTIDQPQFIVEKATAAVKQALSSVANNKVSAASSVDFQWTLNRIDFAIADLILDSSGLGSMLLALIGITPEAYTEKRRMEENLKLFNDTNTAYETESSSVLPDQNFLGVMQLVRCAAVIDASLASADAVYESYDEAVTIRTKLIEAMDELIKTADDGLYMSLYGLRAAVSRDISARSVDSPRLMPYTLNSPVSSVVLAYQLYGDVARENEIIVRNRIRHPGFISGGIPLEVLSR